MECDLPLFTPDPQLFSTLGLIQSVTLYTVLRLSATISIRVYLPAHKLSLWRQCDSHWHTLTQPSIRPKLSPFFGTLLRWWHQPRLGFHIEGLTWQCSLTAYAYPRSAPPRFNMSRLRLPVTFSALAAVLFACTLNVSFPSNHNPKYFRAVQSLICSPFRQKRGV